MGRNGHGGLGAFFGLLALAVVPLLVGGGLLTLRHYTVRNMEEAKSWTATPCVMERCEYVTSDDSDGGRYLEIVYRYEWEGNVYRGDQLDLMSGSFGDDDIMEQRVYESFPAGATATCYVDPADPGNSVFDREHPKDGPRRLWLLAFPFVCTGVGFTFVLIRAAIDVFAQGRRGERRASGDWSKGPASPPRRISPLSGLTVMAGPRSNHAAWLFVVGFLFVFVIMDGPASYARLLGLSAATDATVEGRVTGVSKEPGHEMHKSVFRYTLEYEVGGEVYRGVSFTRGQRYIEGDAVTVVYDPGSPEGGFIAGARPSNFTWVHSAIPLGVLLLLGFGLGAMYRHNLRTLWLLRYGQVATACWRAPATDLIGAEAETRWGEGRASKGRVEVMGRPVETILSDFHFEAMGRSYRAKQFAPGAAKGDDPSDEMVVLYNTRRPQHNIILGETLLDMVDGRRTVGQHLSSVAPILMAIGAVAFMFYGGT